jgi:hypothetical protein
MEARQTESSKKVSFEDLAKIIRTMGPFEEEAKEFDELAHKGSIRYRERNEEIRLP